MNAKLMTLVFLTAFHALIAPPAYAAMSTYAECQSQPSPFGPRKGPIQCCVERHFDAVQACRAQKGCKGVGMDLCPPCLDPVFEMDNCPERAGS